MPLKRTLVSLALIAATSSLAYAGGHGGNPSVKARQSHMQLYAHNLGILGAMAKSEVEYDAEAATAAANNLVALSGMNQGSYWVPGTSNDELGDETRLLPALFEDGGFAKAVGIVGELNAASVELAAVAGDGQEALGPALGAVGKQCTACHEAFQQPNN